MSQFRYFTRLYDRIRDIDGDVVECGLGKGNTFTMLAYLAGSDEKPRMLCGFDSFEGWPEPDPSDASPRNPQKGEWGDVSEGEIWDRLRNAGISRESLSPSLGIVITKGFLGDSLPTFPAHRSIAFLHIDVDLYEGYRDTLRYLFPKVAVGGLVLFDEYKEFHPELPEYVDQETGVLIEKWPGCTKAVDEYFEGRPETVQYYPETGKYYLVKEA